MVWRVLIVNIIATVVIYIFSYAFKNASFYDPYWSLQPIVIVLFLIIEAGERGDLWRQLAVFDRCIGLGSSFDLEFFERMDKYKT